MNRVLAAGIVLTALGLAGYVAGVLVPYPGRAFSVTTLMLGLTLIGIRRVGEGGTPA